MRVFLCKLVDVDDLLGRGCAVEVRLALVGERNLTFLEREERVVGCNLDVAAGHDHGAALADDDRSSLCCLTSVELGTEVLRIRVF